jgi:hypothetical protein
MPYIGHIIPTNQEQDAWEQKDLLPSMFGGIVEDVKRRIENVRRLKEEYEKKVAKSKEMEKYGKFVNGEYIPNKQPNKKKEDKTKIIEDVKEMIKNTESKKKKKHSSDINVTQEYDKLLNDLDQLQKKKKKRKMIDEVTSMLDIPKIKKTSKKSKIIDDTFDMLSNIPKIKKTSKKSKVIDDTFDMLSNIPRVKKSSSKKTKEIGDTLISMMDTQLTNPPKKEPISIDNLLLDIDKTIKQKKPRAKRDKISEKVTDLLSTPQPEIKDTKVLVKASKKAKKIIDAIDKHT